MLLCYSGIISLILSKTFKTTQCCHRFHQKCVKLSFTATEWYHRFCQDLFSCHFAGRSRMIPLISDGTINSFPASGDFCRLLITFANSLNPDKARQNGRSESKLFDTLMVFLKDFLKKVNYKKKKKKKKSTDDKKHTKLPSMQS